MKTYKEGRCNTEAARSRCREGGKVEIPGVNHLKRHTFPREVKQRVLQKDSSKSEWVGLQNNIRTCYNVWFGSDVTDKKTGGRAEGAKIFPGSDQHGQH